MIFLILLCLAFPIGIWLGLEGYELPALFCLIFGWAPVATVIVMALTKEWNGREQYQADQGVPGLHDSGAHGGLEGANRSGEG